jgi:hypothetical protein
MVSLNQDHYGVSEVTTYNTSHTRILQKNVLKVKLYYKLSFEFDYRVFSRILGIKEICGSNHLTNQEWHLAHGMPSLEMAQVRREREREKTCKTTLRQSPSK